MVPFLNSILHLRRRSVWEAADSGILLWRNSFFYFIPFFAIPVWITACVLRLVSSDSLFLSYIILWWLKPLFDRPLLHIVSRQFFGQAGSQKNSGLRNLSQGLGETLIRGLLGDLLWRRFSPGRSSIMPIRILERLKGRQFKSRKKTLAGGGLYFCFFITGLGLLLEAFLLLSEAAFCAMTLQLFLPSVLSDIWRYPELLKTLVFTAYCFNYIFIESLYVCTGFGIYINSRVEVEGWDLQLLFQKFALARSKTIKVSSSAGAKNILPLILFLGIIFTAVSPIANAETPEAFPGNFPLPGQETLTTLEEILASRDFGGTREGWDIRFRYPNEQEIFDLDYAPWMDNFRLVISHIIRITVITAAVVFLVIIYFWFRKNQNFFPGKKPKRENKLYHDTETLSENPESFFSKAEEMYSQGSIREAWAACLYGYMAAYSKYHSISFPKDATEYGCLNLLRKNLPSSIQTGGTGSFEALVHNWVPLAYGGRLPIEGAFEKALVTGRSIRSET